MPQGKKTKPLVRVYSHEAGQRSTEGPEEKITGVIPIFQKQKIKFKHLSKPENEMMKTP